MKLVIQRVKNAKVDVKGKTVGKINKGLMILVGITNTDIKDVALALAKKVSKLRIFDDAMGKINLSIKDVGGEVLSISQFTLYADVKSGNRPSFIDAAEPNFAKEIYDYFCLCLKNEGLNVEKGIFGEHMEVSLINDGPVTIVLEK